MIARATLLILVLAGLILTACAPVSPASPEMLEMQAGVMRTATQAEAARQAGKATATAYSATLQAQAAYDEQARQQLAVAQALDSTRQALDIQQTQIAVDALAATATAAPTRAWETRQAEMRAAAAATLSAHQTATATAEAGRRAQARDDARFALGIVAVFFALVLGVAALRLSYPVLRAFSEGLAQRISARFMLQETSGGIMSYMVLPGSSPGSSMGFYIPAEQIMDVVRIMAATRPALPASDGYDGGEEEGEETPASYFRIMAVLYPSVSMIERGELPPNQFAPHTQIRKMSGRRWSAILDEIAGMGVKIERRDGDGSYLVDERFKGVPELAEAVRAGRLPLPTG